MKNIYIIILVAVSAALGMLYVNQSRKVAQQQTQVAAQRAEVEEKAKAVAALEQAQEQNEQHRRELLRQSDELVAQVRAQQVAVSNKFAAKLASAASDSGSGQTTKDQGGLGSFLSKMMDDPDTRKLIRETQRTMMDQMYAPLVKQMGLTPEEADKFKDLLADNTMKATEQASSMFGGLASSNRTELTSKMVEQQKNYDEEVKALLGDDRYAQYKEYQQSVGERTQLNLYKQQTAGNEHPLTDQQTEQLLGIMKEEKQNAAAASGQPLPGASDNAANLEAMLSSDKMEAMLKGQDTANLNVLNRAKDVLSPEQYEAFGKFLENQKKMMQMGLSMAQKMFAPENKAQPASAAGP